MGPDLSATPRTTACPSCGASARADATFCGQCYADFRPPPPPPVIPSVPPPTASYGVPAPDPLTAPLSQVLPVQPVGDAPGAAPSVAAVGAGAGAVAEATWPCTTCGVANPLSSMSCAACGAGFLAAARTSTTLVLPVVGDIGAMSRGKRLAVAGGVVAAILVPLALITLLLTQQPPKDTGPSTPVPVTEVTSTP